MKKTGGLGTSQIKDSFISDCSNFTTTAMNDDQIHNLVTLPAAKDLPMVPINWAHNK